MEAGEERDRAWMHRRFHELHEKGSEKFGLLWLRANQEAAKAAAYMGIEASAVEHKTLLSEVCYRILLNTALAPPDCQRQAAGEAPYQVCNRCGRKTWAGEEFFDVCGMSQPSGRKCAGRFERQAAIREGE